MKDRAEILDDLARDFSRGIEIICRCSLPSDYITDGQLTCYNQNLVYQGRIISTNDRGSPNLMGDLQEWLSRDPMIIVKGEELKLVKNEPETAKQGDSPTDGFPVTTVGATAGGVAVLVLLLAVVIGTVVACRRYR